MFANTGYHTAVLIRLDGRDCLLVWGGLHSHVSTRSAPTTQMELCELSHAHSSSSGATALSLQWRVGHAQGTEPSPRFGHSCVALSADEWLPQSQKKTGGQNDVLVDRLVFTGGSNGNDLVRNGREIREVRYSNSVAFILLTFETAFSFTHVVYFSSDSHSEYC